MRNESAPSSAHGRIWIRRGAIVAAMPRRPRSWLDDGIYHVTAYRRRLNTHPGRSVEISPPLTVWRAVRAGSDPGAACVSMPGGGRGQGGAVGGDPTDAFRQGAWDQGDRPAHRPRPEYRAQGAAF